MALGSVQCRHPTARGSTSVLAPHGCQTLHYTSPMWQSPHGRNSITHLTLIVLSHHNSITLGCNAVQWHSTRGSWAHQGYGDQRLHNHLERPPQLTLLLENTFAPTTVPVFTTPQHTNYIPRHLSVYKGIYYIHC